MDDRIRIKNHSRCHCSRLELFLIACITIVTIIAAVILTVYIKSLHKESSDQQKETGSEEIPEICETPGCIHAASNVLKYIDPSVDPCEDFYQFACGGFLKETVIPDDKTMVDSTDSISNFLEENLRSILEEPIRPKEAKPYQKLKNLYSICMDVSAIEKDGYTTLNSILEQLGGWPVLKGNDWKGKFDWKNFAYRCRRMGLPHNSFLTLLVTPDARNSSIYSMALVEASLELSQEQFSKGVKDEVVKNYYRFMVDVAVILGANETFAEEEMANALDFEMELAKVTLSQVQMRDLKALYNPRTIDEIQLKFVEIPWVEYINNIVNSPNVRFTPEDEIVLAEPEYIKRLIHLLKITPNRTLANYAFFKVVRAAVGYLTEELTNREQQYFEATYGTRERKARWKECVDIASSKLDHALGALYIRKYFNKDAKTKVQAMVSQIHKELNKTLESTAWMDEETRSKALEKIKAMDFHIAYSDELLTDKNLEEYYNKVEMNSTSYLITVMKLRVLMENQTFAKLRQTVDKNKWTERPSPIVVNAMYYIDDNAIVLPAGILQGIFFDPDRPRYMNYGGIGSVIGHEFTHGFDDMGRQFDKDGNMQNWWTKQTENAFFDRTKCIINQYGKIQVPEIKEKLHGEATQGENIADNGGIKLAYSAYKTWVEKNSPEPQLPGLNYTQEQMFWISSANTWCTKIRNEALRQMVQEDNHVPAKYRVLVPLGNTEDFSRDFHCSSGSKMNPKNKCIVW